VAQPAQPARENLYLQRLNAVIDYARENLHDDLSLNTLAQIASFSPFHFHRLFKSITQETVNDMVVRLRLERAAALLRATPQRAITDIAFDAGFQSLPVFSRAFKKQYGLNASQWDRQTPLKNSKNGQPPAGFSRYTIEHLSDLAGHKGFEVRLRSLPAQRLAYIRVYDSYSNFSQIVDAYHRLLDWFCRRGGRLEQTTLYGMSQDDPDVTPQHLCRFDWCLTIPADWQAEGEISVQDFPACRVAAIHLEGGLEQADKVLHYLFRYWLPHSPYQPANLPGMEIYRRQPAELGWQTFDLDLAVPIVPLYSTT
jgi:AraC family transcriptional regulator